jgi:hypothetical protein
VPSSVSLCFKIDRRLFLLCFRAKEDYEIVFAEHVILWQHRKKWAILYLCAGVLKLVKHDPHELVLPRNAHNFVKKVFLWFARK